MPHQQARRPPQAPPSVASLCAALAHAQCTPPWRLRCCERQRRRWRAVGSPARHFLRGWGRGKAFSCTISSEPLCHQTWACPGTPGIGHNPEQSTRGTRRTCFLPIGPFPFQSVRRRPVKHLRSDGNGTGLRARATAQSGMRVGPWCPFAMRATLADDRPVAQYLLSRRRALSLKEFFGFLVR